jgi:hypothetical protein
VVLWNWNKQSKIVEWKGTEIAARSLGLTLRSVEVLAPEQLDPTLTAILREKPNAMITSSESLTLALRHQISGFALSYRLPMICESREFVVEGDSRATGPAVPIYGDAPHPMSTMVRKPTQEPTVVIREPTATIWYRQSTLSTF